MKVVGFCGPSGVGKTTLIEAVVAGLHAAGQRVSVVKHAHHGFELDTPGKDSWRHRQAGAFEVLLASDQRLALLRAFDAPTLPSPHALLAELAPCDWALVEGFRRADLLKVEVWREALGEPPAYPHDPFVVAVATDRPEHLPAPTSLPVFALDRPAALVDHLLAQSARHLYHPPDHG
jgi:molybdopterin-guanine dinucleotide biosynthesis adapter protein